MQALCQLSYSPEIEGMVPDPAELKPQLSLLTDGSQARRGASPHSRSSE